MAALLNLPPELRLRVYEPLLSRQPYPIYVDEYAAKDCQPEWIQLRRLQKFDPDLATRILSIYWHINTFMMPENYGSFGIDGDSLKWFFDHVQDNVKDLRFVEFGFSSRCFDKDPNVYQSNEVCYNVVSVDIQREKAELLKSGRRGDACVHAQSVVEKLNTILRKRPMVQGRKRMDENDFWALYVAAGEVYPQKKQVKEVDDVSGMDE